MAKTPNLVVFVKAQQPRNPSSVVNRRDRSIRQKQEPTKYDSLRARTKIYLQPCLEHDPLTRVTVPAYIRYFAADLRKNVDMGIAEICFFCREIVTEPSKGWYAPTEKEMKVLEEVYQQRSQEQKEKYARRRARRSVKTSRSTRTQEVGEKIEGEEVSLPVLPEDEYDWLV